MPLLYPTLIPGLRSPSDQIGGLVYFGRMLDKIRLAASGKLPEGWLGERGAVMGSFDWRCCQFLKIDYSLLETETLKGNQDDEALLIWACNLGRKPDTQEIEVWNAFMTKRGWNDAGTPFVTIRLAEIGLPPGTVQTMFEFIDLDEGRLHLPATETQKSRIAGPFLILPSDLSWRQSNLMRIPNADYLERTGSENLGARLWRLPPGSANTLHKHIRAEEFYFVLEGTGRLRVDDDTLTVPQYGGVLIGPAHLRQVFNDTDTEVLWLIVAAPEEIEFLPGAKIKPDLTLVYPVDPSQLPRELAGAVWPPKD